MTAFTRANASGTLVASVISKMSRNEVHMHVFSSGNGPSGGEVVQRFDLERQASITSVSWFNDVEQKKKSKKRTADSNGTKNNEHSPQGLLALVLNNSEVLVLSPYSDTPLHRITELKEVYLVAGSSTPNCFWAHTPDALIEYNISTQNISKQIKVPKMTITCIQPVSAHKKDLLAYGHSQLSLVDPARNTQTAKIQTGSPICDIKQANTYLYVASQGSSIINVYDLNNSSEQVATLECAGEVTKLNKLDDDQIVAFTANCTQVFTKTELVNTLQGPVENLFSQNSGYVAVVYDRNQPEFRCIAELPSHLQIQAKQSKSKKSKKTTGSDLSLNDSKPVRIENLPPSELYNKLTALITAPKISRSKVLRLCSSNDDEENIKETFRLFSQSEHRELLVKNLFTIVSSKVAADPSSKSSLSIWLKWILLTHGGYISKQESLREYLKKLQRSFEDGMTMMSRLLALQGRLQLLKAHAEFRSQVAQAEEQLAEIESEEEDDEEEENSLADQSANVEESIVYANGENDDFDSVDVGDESIAGEDEASDDEFVSFDEEA
ncbi:hypothetical protein CJJ07_005172 [Candidozyma auris]|nr:hypothetical protein CJJ07_005172 [[Candida] auris]